MVISKLVNWLVEERRGIVLIMIVALVLRLVAINQSLWLDEAIGAYAVKNFTYKALLGEFMKFDFHPPLYYLALKAWTGVFGYSELSIRFPSILLGLGTIWFSFLIARKIAGKANQQFPLLAAGLLATSQFHIYYSQEARMYSMAAFFAVSSIYFLINLLENKNKIKFLYLVSFSLSISGLIFSDYMPIFLFPLFFVVPFIYRMDKNWWIRYLLAFIPLVVLTVVWTPTFIIQSSAGRKLMESLPAWRNIIGGSNAKQLALVWMKFVFGRISLSNKMLYYFLVMLASAPFIISFRSAVKKRNLKIDILFLWLIIPLGLGFLASFLFPAFKYFRYVYIVPAFYLLVAWGSVYIKKRSIRLAVIVSIVVVNILSWLIYVVDINQQREQWRRAVLFIEEQVQTSDIVIFEYPRPFTPYRWYSKGVVKSLGITDAVASDPKIIKQKTKNAISGFRGVYYFEYLADLSDPGRVAEEVLKKGGYKVSEVYNFNGVGQIFYWIK